MTLKYNPADAAVVTALNGWLNVTDKNGGCLFRQQMTAGELDAELRSLEALGNFKAVPEFEIVINVEHAGRLRHYNENDGRGMFAVDNMKGGSIVKFWRTTNASKEFGEKIINGFVSRHPQFVQLPGYLSVLNARAIASVTFDKAKSSLQFMAREGD